MIWGLNGLSTVKPNGRSTFSTFFASSVNSSPPFSSVPIHTILGNFNLGNTPIPLKSTINFENLTDFKAIITFSTTSCDISPKNCNVKWRLCNSTGLALMLISDWNLEIELIILSEVISIATKTRMIIFFNDVL